MTVTGYTTAGAGAAFAPKSAAWVASTPVVAGQLLHNAGTLYRVTTSMTTPASFNTTNLTVVSSGGTAGVAAVVWDGTGAQPARPVTSTGVPVLWICPTQPTGAGTVGGGAGAVDGLDVWLRTP